MTEQSPSELERDAERVRADIAETAEQLRDKMSPGQLMDEVVDYFKDGDANRLLTNLKHQVRDNPLALAVVGSGLAWLMMGSGTNAPTNHRNAGSRVGTRASSASASPGPSSSNVAATLGSGVSGAKDAVSSAAGKVEEGASSAADAFTESMHDLREYASDTASQIEHSASDLGERAKSTFLDALEREPLVIGALGVAVGAAIGTMIPATQAEKDYLGPAGAKARDSAEAALAEGAEKAKHVAADVYAAARDEADRQGLLPGEKPVAGRVADVARAAGDELRSATDRSLRDVEEKADEATDRLTPDGNRS